MNKKHPLALFGHEGGAKNMKAGDRVVYTIDARHGVAFVVFDTGEFETVKWNHLELESG